MNNITQREKEVRFNFKYNQSTGLSSAVQLLIWGKRNLNDDGSYYPLYPQNSSEAPTAYTPYVLPAYQNGLSALIGMQNLGFRVGFGTTDVLTFPAPSSVTSNDQGYTVLTWNIMPAGFLDLLQSNSNITVSQVTSQASGIAVDVNNNSNYNIIVQTNGLNAFTTQYQITLTVNTVSQLPNPDKTDEIAMCVYRAFNGINGSLSNGSNPSIPTVSIAYFNPQDQGDSPNPNPINLGLVNVVQNLSDGVGLYWDNMPNLAGYVPNSQLGNTIIRSKQDPSIQGTVVQYLPATTQIGFAVELTNVQGTFESDMAVELVLDASQSPFVIPKYRSPFYRFQYVPLPYEIKTLQDFNNPLYANYFSYISSPSTDPNAVLTMGCFGTMNTSIQSLPNLNCRNAVQVIYSVYKKSFGQPKFTLPELTAQAMAIVCTNSVPYNPMDDTVLAGIPVSNRANNQPDPALSPIATSKGWSNIVVNSLGQASFARVINGGTTIPSTTNFDFSYYDATVSQILMLWYYSVRFLINENVFKNITTASLGLQQELVIRLQSLAMQFNNAGMFVGMNQPNPDIPNNQTPISNFSVVATTENGGTWKVNTPIFIRSIILKVIFNVNINNTLSSTNTQG